jgi:hypothetical protein
MYLITLAVFWLTVSLDLFILLPADEAWILWYDKNSQRDESHVVAALNDGGLHRMLQHSLSELASFSACLGSKQIWMLTAKKLIIYLIVILKLR